MGNVNGTYNSWLGSLLSEMTLNEIDANAAYEKFYSNIPREDYDKILATAGVTNPDKFTQFFLNDVRDGEIGPDVACQILNMFKNSDQLIKDKIIKSFSQGLFGDVKDIYRTIIYLEKGGTVMSRKEMINSGIVTVAENERWKVTCTTNYAANNGIFGKMGAHWCTASDRNGSWDGYQMFERYTNNAALLQFTWKGKSDSNITYSDILKDIDKNLGYTGEVIPERYKTIQFVVKEPVNGEIRVVGNSERCDALNSTIDYELLRELVGEDIYSLLTNEEVIKGLITKTNESRESEKQFETYFSELERRRRQREDEKLRKKLEELNKKCQEKNEKKLAFVAEKWKEFLDQKMYLNQDMITKIRGGKPEEFEEDEEGFAHPTERSEEDLLSTNYVVVSEYCPISEQYSSLVLRPYFGYGYTAKVVGDVYNNNRKVVIEKTNVTPAQFKRAIYDLNCVSLLVRRNTFELVRVNGENLDGSPMTYFATMFSNEDSSNEENERFLITASKNGENDKGYIKWMSSVYDFKTKKTFNIDGEVSGGVFLFKGLGYVFFDYSLMELAEDGEKDLNEEPEGIYLYKEGDDHADNTFFNEGRGRFYLIPHSNYSGDLAYIMNGGNCQYLFYPIYGLQGHKIMSTDRISSFMPFTRTSPCLHPMFFGVNIENGGQECQRNVISDDCNEFVFSHHAHNIFLNRKDGNITCLAKYLISKNLPNSHKYQYNSENSAIKIVTYYGNGKYTLEFTNPRTQETTKPVPCDRDEKTEKDKLSDKNLQAWKDKGGYSPEQQAQMDAMWNDRNDKEPEGSRAMRDWNDDDAYVYDTKENPYHYFRDSRETAWDKPLYKSMQPDSEKDNWGHVFYGEKDPESHDKEMYKVWGPVRNYIKTPYKSGELTKMLQGIENSQAPDYVRRNPFYRVDKHGKPIDQPWYTEDEIPAKLSDRVIREEVEKFRSIWNRMKLL